MRKAKSETADIQRLRTALVREGLATYPKAMQAIAEFRHEVFEILKRVAERKKAEISQIVGGKEFEPESDEVDTFLDGPDTVLRVAMGPLCSFSLEFFWADVGRPSATVGIAATIWCDKKATFERVATALQDEFGEDVVTDDEERWCSHEKTIQPEQFDKLESELGKLCDAWIRKLRAVNVPKLIRSTR
jgi:hypothetical protein